MRIVGSIGDQRLAHARDTGRSLRSVGTSFASHQHVYFIAERLCRRDGIQDRRFDRTIVVFRNNQNRHQITFASFLSFSTSSSTDLTCWPALLFGGSLTLRVFNRGSTSTSSVSGDSFSRGFFFAFMMFGKVT